MFSRKPSRTVTGAAAAALAVESVALDDEDEDEEEQPAAARAAAALLRRPWHVASHTPKPLISIVYIGNQRVG